MGTIEIPLKISKRYLVGRLKFAIIVMVFLNSIIGEVHKLIFEILYVEIFGGCSNIPFLKPVALLIPVDTTDANEGTNIKFPLFHK